MAVSLLVVAVAVLAIYWPALSAQATYSDDQQYVLHNPLVQNPSWNSVGRFFREISRPSTVSGYYQPLAMTSLMLDCALGGGPDDLRPLRRTSLALHVLNSALVVVFLYLVSGRPLVAAVVGLLFAAHPLTVETVVWLSERKTLLATFFVLWSLILYVLHARRPSWLLAGSALCAFVLAVLSKPTSVPLPILLLLLAYWPLRRLSLRAVGQTVPFFIVAGVSAVITVVSQSRAGGQTVPVIDSPWRVPLTLCHNTVFYPLKFVWPANVTSYYPFPEPFDLSHPMLLAGVAGTALLIPALLLSWRWTRAPVTGWLFFMAGIFPGMGVISFTDVIAANRYAYLPMLGFLLIAAWLLGGAWDRAGRRAQSGAWRAGLLALVVCLVTAAAAGTRRQLGYWQNTERLHRYMLTLTPGAGPLLNNLGTELVAQGRVDEAIEAYAQATQSKSGMPMAHFNLATELEKKGRVEEAVYHYTRALPMKAWEHLTRTRLGQALAKQGRYAEAVKYLSEAIRLRPDYAPAHGKLGRVLIKQKHFSEAVACLVQAVRLDPSLDWAYLDLGKAATLEGSRQSFAKALPHFERRAQLDPNSAQAHDQLAAILAGKGELTRAVEHYSTALHIEPGLVYTRLDLGNVLLELGRIDEAIRVYEAGLHLNPEDGSLRLAVERAKARQATPTRP